MYSYRRKQMAQQDMLDHGTTHFVFPKRIHEQKRMYPNYNPACPRNRTPMEIPRIHTVRSFYNGQMGRLLHLHPFI
jgi:hypothetical protein